MSSSSEPDVDVKKSNRVYDVGCTVEVLGGPHTGSKGSITQVHSILYVTLENGVQVHGPYTQFKLLK